MIQNFAAHTINCGCHSIRSMFRVFGIYYFEFRMFRPLVYRALEDYIGFLLLHRRQSRHWLIFLSLFKLDLFFEPRIHIFLQLYAHRKRKSWQILVRSLEYFELLFNVYRALEDYNSFLSLIDFFLSIFIFLLAFYSQIYSNHRNFRSNSSKKSFPALH